MPGKVSEGGLAVEQLSFVTDRPSSLQGVKARPSKKGRSTSSALLPMKDKAKQQQKKHKMKGSLKRVHVDGQQKNRDVDQREAINLQEQSLRHELVRKLDEVGIVAED